MSEHTAGPWEAVEHGDIGSGWWSVLRGAWDVSHNGAADPGVVADCRFSAMTPEENAANARLIAAAPDLLEACEWAMLAASLHAGGKLNLDSAEWSEFTTRASAAIQKATGENHV